MGDSNPPNKTKTHFKNQALVYHCSPNLRVLCGATRNKAGVEVGGAKNLPQLFCCTYMFCSLMCRVRSTSWGVQPTKPQDKITANTKQRRPPAISSCFYRFGRLLGRRFRRGDRCPSPGKSESTATRALARHKRRGAFHHPSLARRACFVRGVVPAMAASLMLHNYS